MKPVTASSARWCGLLCAALLACGGVAPVNGGSGRGLRVLAAGQEIGVLLDVSGNGNVWLLWSAEHRAMFSLRATTGRIQTTVLLFSGPDCTGSAWSVVEAVCLASDLIVGSDVTPRIFSDGRGDAWIVDTNGQRLFPGARSTLNPDGTCDATPVSGGQCGQSARRHPIHTTFPLPVTLLL